ncbi:hypothetical protein PAXRUDRAFT_834342 [Paxillus rubicundulus Ve08.2h10]|uniref:Uncharacterized protein n=1 Tax=Paxillus rubicundulus Ve08.2h10 TaxID=930991 RepID=A0A0D0DL24_9AGAM|nr:hypothetical protein PAXRUDRAFT_834342 [Paxillus rubicundulus Ve08.2h10]
MAEIDTPAVPGSQALHCLAWRTSFWVRRIKESGDENTRFRVSELRFHSTATRQTTGTRRMTICTNEAEGSTKRRRFASSGAMDPELAVDDRSQLDRGDRPKKAFEKQIDRFAGV